MKTINNNIEERRVSFPVAKLLKEAGFGVYGYLQDVWLGNSYLKGKEIPVFGIGLTSKLPTQQLAIDFLVENFPEIVKNYKNIPLCTATKEEKEQFIQDILKLAE